MSDSWKSIKEMRETSIDISGGFYSSKYANKYNLTDKSVAERLGEKALMLVPELIEITICDNSEILYRAKEIGEIYKEYKEKFETSLGTFISHNHGEFGGELITQKEHLRGNFIEVFECDGITYAIDSCSHMGAGHINIYTFSKKLKSKMIYTSEGFNDNTLRWISFKSLFLTNTYAYVLASGKMKKDYRKKDSKWVGKTYLFEIRNGKIEEKLELDYNLIMVENMIVCDNKLIVGMDKIIIIVDMTTKEIKAYTPISIEAEKDIIEVQNSQ